MYRVTILFGVLLGITGVVGFYQSGAKHPTALIPAFIGIPMFVCGIIAAKAEAVGVTTDELEREILSRISLRQYVTSEDIAEMAVFLCSDVGRHISGQAISVCGNVESMC